MIVEKVPSWRAAMTSGSLNAAISSGSYTQNMKSKYTSNTHCINTFLI